jgi:hypothetical protein
MYLPISGKRRRAPVSTPQTHVHAPAPTQAPLPCTRSTPPPSPPPHCWRGPPPWASPSLCPTWQVAVCVCVCVWVGGKGRARAPLQQHTGKSLQVTIGPAPQLAHCSCLPVAALHQNQRRVEAWASSGQLLCRGARPLQVRRGVEGALVPGVSACGAAVWLTELHGLPGSRACRAASTPC